MDTGVSYSTLFLVFIFSLKKNPKDRMNYIDLMVRNPPFAFNSFGCFCLVHS